MSPQVNTSCKICEKVIYVEENPVHLGCVSAREKSLVNMIISLRCEINAMKVSFKSVETIFKSLEMAANIADMQGECDIDVHTPSSKVKIATPLTTKEHQMVNMLKENAKKKKNSENRIVTRSRARQQIPPQALPKATLVQSEPITRKLQKSTPVTAIDVVEISTPNSARSTLNSNSESPQTALEGPSACSTSQAEGQNEDILITVNPSKNVFLSGLSPEMTENLVNEYVDMKCKVHVPVNVKKMRLREGADHSSFIILTGRNKTLFERLVDPTFWPPNTIVDVFTERNFRNVKPTRKRMKPNLIVGSSHAKAD